MKLFVSIRKQRSQTMMVQITEKFEFYSTVLAINLLCLNDVNLLLSLSFLVL